MNKANRAAFIRNRIKENEANRAAMQKGMKRRPVKNRPVSDSEISFDLGAMHR